jgi:DNA-binding XRE family transcriptional regulator
MRKQDKKLKKSAHNQDGTLSSPQSKAERLKRVRNLANLSREAICSDSDVNLTTLISWEVGRFGGLSKKGAASVVARVAKEGVFVTPEWLLYEVGLGPEVRTDFKKSQKTTALPKSGEKLLPEKSRIIEELMVFRKLNKNPIDFVVEDDAMLPHYRVGDYVAGTMRQGEKINSLIGYDCIVQIVDGRIVFRNLQRGPRNGSFNLVSTNLQAGSKNTVIYDVELVSAAPVLWHRRRNIDN